MKGGQAQGPLVKSIHIPLLSEGIQANHGLLGQKAELITKGSIKYFKITSLLTRYSPC